jgi:D-alanine transaminase
VSIAFLNGAFLPLQDASVPVMDRGFLFGDGVYEVIPVYAGKLFRLDQHLKRLGNSLAAIRIENPLSSADWQSMLHELVSRNAEPDQAVYLQVTRGVAAKRDHAFPPDCIPTVFAMSTAMPPPADIDKISGATAVTFPDIRWKLCNIKAITLLPNVMLRQQAIDAGAAEAILIREGYAVEGAASNLFIVKDGMLITPPNSPTLLPGVTRDLIIELAANHAVAFREADISEAELFSADEIWLSSSTREISPVTLLDETVISNGKPGPIWKQMISLYQDCKSAIRRGEAG